MNRLSARGLTFPRPLAQAATVLLAAVVLASCGGGGYDGPPPPSSCSVAENKQWLRDYFYGNAYTGQAPWYFWYRFGPNPDPSGYADENAYFEALKYTGTNATFPADRWSFHQSTSSFNQFFGAGKTLGYGLFVAGLEVANQPTQPLYVRYIEPLSPAAALGLRRGDRILSVNGVAASTMIQANDFSALTPATALDSITVVYSRGGVTQPSIVIQAAVFDLSPLNGVAIVTTPLNRRLGYIQVKDMISQVGAPLAAAIASFKAAPAVSELVIDIRYNGGGLVSTGRDIASYVTSSAYLNGLLPTERSYASLLYNDQQAATNNSTFPFQPTSSSLGLTRVFVLTGRRTCSASEQVVNGLRGIGVDVVVIGETTCGKPVGFLPADNGCGETYSVVNFESVNARNEGRYFDGFAPVCAVAEDFTQPQGSGTDPLLIAASDMADGGACPTAGTTERPQALRASPRRSGASDGERPMMIPR